MKKILISIFSLLLIIGVSNTVNACETCGCKDAKKEIKKECSSDKKSCCSKSPVNACQCHELKEFFSLPKLLRRHCLF